VHRFPASHEIYATGNQQGKSVMTLFNISVDAMLVMLPLLAGSVDPLTTLYSLLAGTYGGAAVAASANDHRSLCRCYVIGAVLHGLIGVCHHLGV
jgi:hypothetical protein